jgi:hypothetical protein
MTSTFDMPIMRHVIVYGNEAEIEAELERIKFELKQLAARELGWEEDRERARLRAKHDSVANTVVVEDSVELVETDQTYLGLWQGLRLPERGSWLAEHGFRVTADKEHVTVSQGSATATVALGKPEYVVRETQAVYQGKCECGCGADVYGTKYGKRKRYINGTHRIRADRRRAAAAHEAQAQSGP